MPKGVVWIDEVPKTSVGKFSKKTLRDEYSTTLMGGFAIYKPAQLSLLVSLFGGYGNARFVHFTATIVLMLFFVVHIVQVIRSGRRNAASIITGYRVEERAAAERGVRSGRPADVESEAATS
jgi:hypothetical protein